MAKLKIFLADLHPYLLSYIASVLTISQAVLSFFYHGPDSPLCEWLGWICLWSAGIFGMLPILTFRKFGNVSKGKSYLHTTRLVDKGLYAVVRHPQNGTAWLLINLGIMVITRHWTNFLIGLLSMILVYLDTIKADDRCIRKFGDKYLTYMKKVPSVNFLLGIVRFISGKDNNKN